VIDGLGVALRRAGRAREMKQWVFKISNISQELLTRSIRWIAARQVRLMQRNWIGRSEGC